LYTGIITPTGFDDERGYERIEDLVKAHALLLFPLIRFDEMLVWLHAAHPDRFSDCRYAVQNLRPGASEQYGRPESREVLKAFQEYCEFDNRLVSLANDRLDAMLLQDLGTPAQIKHDLAALQESNVVWRKRGKWGRRWRRWRGL